MVVMKKPKGWRMQGITRGSWWICGGLSTQESPCSRIPRVTRDSSDASDTILQQFWRRTGGGGRWRQPEARLSTSWILNPQFTRKHGTRWRGGTRSWPAVSSHPLNSILRGSQQSGSCCINTYHPKGEYNHIRWSFPSGWLGTYGGRYWVGSTEAEG